MTNSQPARGCELKACPFCGGAAIMLPPTCNRDTPYNEADRAFPEVRCIGAVCGGSAHGINWDQSGHSAIAAWNTRVAGGGVEIIGRIQLAIAATDGLLDAVWGVEDENRERIACARANLANIERMAAALQVKP